MEKLNLEIIKSYNNRYWLSFLKENSVFDADNIETQFNWLINEVERLNEINKKEEITDEFENVIKNFLTFQKINYIVYFGHLNKLTKNSLDIYIDFNRNVDTEEIFLGLCEIFLKLCKENGNLKYIGFGEVIFSTDDIDNEYRNNILKYGIKFEKENN